MVARPLVAGHQVRSGPRGCRRDARRRRMPASRADHGPQLVGAVAHQLAPLHGHHTVRPIHQCGAEVLARVLRHRRRVTCALMIARVEYRAAGEQVRKQVARAIQPSRRDDGDDCVGNRLAIGRHAVGPRSEFPRIGQLVFMTALHPAPPVFQRNIRK